MTPVDPARLAAIEQDWANREANLNPRLYDHREVGMLLAAMKETVEKLNELSRGHLQLDADYLAAKAELARLRAEAPAWQPISSAPQDGTVVFGWNSEWSARMPEMMLWKSSRLPQWTGWHTYTGHYLFTRQPTHWMPLPPPPSVKGDPPKEQS